MTLATLTDTSVAHAEPPRIVALDLSLTCTGVADANGCRTIRPKSTGMERLAWVREAVLRACHPDGSYEGFGCHPEFGCVHPDLVVIEGYAFGRPQQATHLGELGGVVRLALWEAGIPFVDVAPKSLKLYATGRGNAGKAEVLTTAVKRLGYDGHDDNEADALWLRAMAMDHYGSPVVAMPAEHRKALAAVKWPQLAVTA